MRENTATYRKAAFLTATNNSNIRGKDEGRVGYGRGSMRKTAENPAAPSEGKENQHTDGPQQACCLRRGRRGHLIYSSTPHKPPPKVAAPVCDKSQSHSQSTIPRSSYQQLADSIRRACMMDHSPCDTQIMADPQERYGYS